MHLAALGGVPRSLEHPLDYHDVNVRGFLEVVDAARCVGVRTTVYASSSSVYGDLQTLPQSEARVGAALALCLDEVGERVVCVGLSCGRRTRMYCR